jgi:hypothetical protein
MTGYSTPADYVAGTAGTAAFMNQYVRDVLKYLTQRSAYSGGDAVLIGTANTTSATFADVSGSDLSVTTVEDAMMILITFVGNLWVTAGSAVVALTATVDGSNIGHVTQGLCYFAALGTGYTPVCFAKYVSVASAGSHTVKLQWSTSASTLNLLANTGGFAVKEVG